MRLRPDHEHPVTRGFACSKGLRAADLNRHPDRVRQPLRRDGDGFVPVSWEEAIGDIAMRVQAIIDRHGPRGVGMYLGNPNAFNALGGVGGGSFAPMLGSDRMFSAVTQDCSNKYAVSELLYGMVGAHPIPDLERTEFLLVIGSNPRVSKSSFLSVADPVKALREVRDRGGRVVFVNPLAIEPAIGPTLQLRPDSDPYLLAAILHEIHRTVGFDLGVMDGRVIGIDDVVAFVAPYSPARVADVVGLPADVIAALALDFATTPRASIHVSTGVNMGRQGALAYWLVQMLLLLTGKVDRPGGSYFAARGMQSPPPVVDRTEASFEATPWGSYRRAVGMIPSALLPEVIEADDAPLRALFVLAGNPAVTVGGGDRIRDALASLDLLVSVDLFVGATAELAHYVLPATDQFEREDLNFFVQGVQAEPFLQWTDAVVEPDGEQRPEWQIFGALLQAMGHTPILDPATADPLPLLFDARLSSSGASIAALRDAGGVITQADPGPGGSFDRLGIGGAIECVPPALRGTLARAHALFGSDSGGFSLITRRTRNRLNSTLEPLVADEPTPLWMHPDDAAQLGLVAGAKATVTNDHGTLAAVVDVDPNLRPGVVAMTHGSSTVNVNVLAPTGPGTFDPVSGMAHVTGISVDVSPS